MFTNAEEAVLFERGQALRAAGRWQEAVDALKAAAEVNPDRAETLLSLGVIHLQQHEFASAERFIRRALALRPGYDQGWDALGLVQTALDQHAAAFDAFSRAAALNPLHLPFLLHRVEAAIKSGQAARMREYLEQETEADPLAIGQLVGLGLLAIRERRVEDAISHLEAAHTLDAAVMEAPMLLGIAYTMAMQPGRAAPMLRLAMDHDPDNAGIINDLAIALARLYHYEESAALLTASIEKFGPSLHAYSNLTIALAALGQMQEASEAAKSAMAMAPGETFPHRAYCNLLPYLEGVSAADMLAALRAAAATVKLPRPLPVAVSREPERKLRIGLLSNMLRTHPVGWLTLAGLEALDREQFSIHCFGWFDENNSLAKRYARFAASWHQMEAMDDATVARVIHEQRIDILLELGGFGDAGRINVCAWRPAPLQVKWVGAQYHSTALPFIDYFLTDPRETPAGYEEYYTEKLLRLPDGYVCYLPPPYAPDVGPLPAVRNGHVTFGCFNNLTKITPSTLAAWAKILHAVPESRLMLRCPQFSEPGPRERMGRFFDENGIDPERIAYSGRALHREFLATYNEVDIVLDPFPYSGGLSTCEALYMGAPVLTRAGEIFAARHSVSHLANVGLPGWIAETDAEYVAKAIGFARDIPGLAELRAGLRAQVTLSPLCDAPRFGKNLGTALRNIWRDYCRNGSGA